MASHWPSTFENWKCSLHARLLASEALRLRLKLSKNIKRCLPFQYETTWSWPFSDSLSVTSIISHFMNMIWSILRPKWSFVDIGWLMFGLSWGLYWEHLLKILKRKSHDKSEKMKLNFDTFDLSLMTKEAKKLLLIHAISTVCYYGLFYLLTMVMFWHVAKAA